MRLSALFQVGALVLLAGCLDEEGANESVQCNMAPSERPFFQTSEPLPMDEILQQMVKCVASQDAAQTLAAQRAADASRKVRETLTGLYLNLPPDVQALSELGASQMNGIFHRADRPEIHATLLSEAVSRHNYAWAKALLEAGADPNASGSLMAYTVGHAEIFDPRSSFLHYFKDGRPAVPFLELYVEYGGDVNTTQGGGFNGMPLVRGPFNNLAGHLYLLEQGGDPWVTGQSDVRPNWFRWSAFGNLSSSIRAIQEAERMYMVINAGQFSIPQEPLYRDLLLSRLETHLEVLTQEASGPSNRHDLWGLQKVLGALIEREFFVPSARMTQLLDTHAIPDKEGGWITPEGQLHQDYDDPRSGAVLGSEQW